MSRKWFDRALQRAQPRKASGDTFLIVTEGKKTEPNYFKAVKDRLRLSAAQVVILHPEGTDPLTLTQAAIDLRAARKRDAKRGELVEFDEVWVVFDFEKQGDHRRKLAKQALLLGAAEGIKFAASDPCFEFWLVLHEEYTTKAFMDCDAVVKVLKKHWPDYAKENAPSQKFLQKLPRAVTHAARVRKHHCNASGDGNPSTDVDLLVRILNRATRPHLRFDLGL